jgi:hypothetical protein
MREKGQCADSRLDSFTGVTGEPTEAGTRCPPCKHWRNPNLKRSMVMPLSLCSHPGLQVAAKSTPTLIVTLTNQSPASAPIIHTQTCQSAWITLCMKAVPYMQHAFWQGLQTHTHTMKYHHAALLTTPTAKVRAVQPRLFSSVSGSGYKGW